MTSKNFRLTIHMVSSVDGFIAKKDNSISWFETTDNFDKGVDGADAAEFLRSVDCYVMGSHTYELATELAKEHGWAYGDTPAIVLTSRHLQTDRPNIEFYNGDLEKLIKERLKPNYTNVWMVGGAMLVKEFIQLKLADEVRISILPTLLGEGLSFFDHIGREQPLHLADCKAYKNGMVELCYEIIK